MTTNQRKFGNLTSDYTESCRKVLRHRCLTAEMFYSTDAGHERFWRVGIARNAVSCRCLRLRMLNLWKGCKFRLAEMLLSRDHFAWQLQEFVCLGSTLSWQAQYFWSIHLKIVKTHWNSEVKCLVNMSFLKEVSQKCFVFDLQRLIFEGSLAEMLRFWSSTLDFWRKSRRNVSFLIFKASFLISTPGLKPIESHIKCTTNRMTRKPIESQSIWIWNHLNLITWISPGLNLKPFESQINWQPIGFQISWQPAHLNLKSLEPQSNWIANHLDQSTWISNQLNFKATESQSNWISNQMTFKTAETNWQPIIWISNQWNLKSQRNRSSNHLNFKSIESQIVWISNQLNLKSIESDMNWVSNQLNSTPSSYRFLIFGNFRHRLVR